MDPYIRIFNPKVIISRSQVRGKREMIIDEINLDDQIFFENKLACNVKYHHRIMTRPEELMGKAIMKITTPHYRIIIYDKSVRYFRYY